MSDAVKLLFGVHAHQPAGNFPEVVRDAHERCYGPFLRILERYPDFRFAMHISGWLMQFLQREFPEDMNRLRSMVARGQTEIFGGGDTEPVLAAIPDADRDSQLHALSRRIHRRYKAWPHGAWLTERVWEATIVPSLVRAGLNYVAVDDYHFLCAGQPADTLDGHFTTEEGNLRLDLFPISEALRYKIPFAPVPDAIAHLEGMRPGGAAIYFDDIEKFGIWPETHDWVYGRRWLEDFIEAVLRSPAIEPMHYGDYDAHHRARGVIYLPSVSYYEMSEWTLPPAQAGRFAQLVERAKHEGTFWQDKVYLRGGMWRNFFTRYPESNWMHKRMQSVSAAFHLLPKGRKTASMQSDLHLAQANDAYWHGLFGGIYLPHLRRNVYAAIARLEAAIHASGYHPSVERYDLDCDDENEIFLRCPSMLAVVKPNAGASIRELTHYGLAHNFADTLARREEHYHRMIEARKQPASAAGGGIASIHDRVAFRTAIAEGDLIPDRHPQTIFVDFWRPDGADEQRVAYEALQTKGGAVNFSGECAGLSIAKRIKVGNLGPTVTYALAAQTALRGTFGVELNLAMPSCDGPGGAYLAGSAFLGGFGDPVALAAPAVLRLEDSELGASLRVIGDPSAALTAQPHYTVSQSESGFEKIWQAAKIRATWPIEMQPGETKTMLLRLRVLLAGSARRTKGRARKSAKHDA